MPAIIKAGQQDPKLFRRLDSVSVSDHFAEARLVLEKSRDEARRVLREAQAEAVRIREQTSQEGYESGFRRGYDAGKQAGHDEAFTAARAQFESDQTQTLAALRAAIDEYETRKRDLFIAARQDVIRFAARVAEKITRQVGAVHPETAVANLETALRLVAKPTDLTVHVSPADRTTIERFGESLAARLDDAPHLTIVVDESIAPGGCRVTTDDAEIDATLDTQIARIVELMVPATGGESRDRETPEAGETA